MILQFLDSDNVELRELDLIVFIFTNCPKMTLSDSRKIGLAVIWIWFFYSWFQSQRVIEPVIKYSNKCRYLYDISVCRISFNPDKRKQIYKIKYMAPYYSSSVWNFVIFLRKHNKYNKKAKNKYVGRVEERKTVTFRRKFSCQNCYVAKIDKIQGLYSKPSKDSRTISKWNNRCFSVRKINRWMESGGSIFKHTK